jgi:hypothetical protein
MQKFIFLLMFMGCAFFAQAGTYYAGINYVHQLLTGVTQSDGTDIPNIPDLISVNPDTGETVTNNNETDNPQLLTDFGINWLRQVPGNEVMYWQNDGDLYKYNFVESVSWANNGYIQKSDVTLSWTQPDVLIPASFLTSAEANAIQDVDLQYLQSLDFSGNSFRQFELDGADITPITTIDFSDNPTLVSLKVDNCPELTKIDVTNSPLVIVTVTNCPLVEIIGARTGIQTPVSNNFIRADKGKIIVSSSQNETVSIYTVDGRLVSQKTLTAGTSTLPLTNGLYIVRLSDGTAQKALVK